jgi:hypothetical protein
MSLSACENFRSPVPTPPPEPTVRVTAKEVAQAMQDDRFFSDYGSSILLVRGEISSVEQQETFTVVALRTSSPEGVACEIAAGTTAPVGQMVTVRARSADAQRSGPTVVLHNCHLV